MRFFCVSFSFNKADPRYSSYEEIERFFDSFDYPIAMDKNNILSLIHISPRGGRAFLAWEAIV